MNAALLVADGLKKSFAGESAEGAKAFELGPLSFRLAAGETLALLGKNGAGKTTLFQILTGNADATGGELKVGGEKLTPEKPEVKRRLGYLPQNPVLPRWVTGKELLGYAAGLYGLGGGTRIEQSLEYWDAASYAKKPIATLSYGMQKRLGLALATLHDPEVLILDEPFSGLDLFHIKALDDEILRRAGAGKGTIVSTHVASFAARLCPRALILDAGKMTELAGYTAAPMLDRIARIEAAFFGKGAG